MDPQRLGSPTAAYDLHFQEQFLQQKHDLSSKGFLTVEYMGKREQLPVNTKGSQVSPRLAEVVVKQLDPRWARRGATAALLKAAGYSTDVANKTEYAGDLPAHLSCWSSHISRSDVAVAKVAAPALRSFFAQAAQVHSVSRPQDQHLSLAQLAKQARATPCKGSRYLRQAESQEAEATGQQATGQAEAAAYTGSGLVLGACCI